MRPRTRAVGVVVLLSLVVVAGVHYGAVEDSHRRYPSPDALATDYGSHVGERALLFGTVEAVDRAAGTARIRVDSREGVFPMTVSGFDATVRPGGTVQAFGPLRPDRRIDAERVAVVDRAGSSKTYKYVVSAVGVALVVVAVLRRWRPNVRRLVLEARR